MNIPLIETNLPYTFSTYKGNLHWTFHNYFNFLLLSTNSEQNVLEFAHVYRLAQKGKKNCIQLALPGNLRVVRDKPVLGRWCNNQVYFNEHTETLCTYNTDKMCKKMYLILDEAMVPQNIFSGLYKASVRIRTRPEFWNQDCKPNECPYAQQAMVQAEIQVTLEDFIEPFFTKLDFQESAKKIEEQKKLKFDTYQPAEFPKTLKDFFKDFKNVFGM